MLEKNNYMIFKESYMKRILTICLVVVVAIAAISCGNIYKKESLPKYDIGVIKTSQYKKESII